MVFLITLAQALKTATPNRIVVWGEFRKNKRPGQEGFVWRRRSSKLSKSSSQLDQKEGEASICE